MTNKKSTIIEKHDVMPCWKCDAKGLIDGQLCDLCNGSGEWIERHYIVIDEKNKIAFDSDTGG
jgi:hypothetical protein